MTGSRTIPETGKWLPFRRGLQGGRPEQRHQTALGNGGTCEGPPGLRPQYHDNYYGAYFRDPDGNKICVACHAPAVDGA